MIMKRILLALTIALAGLFATSCVQEHIEAQFIPGNVTTQGLGQISGCTLAEDGNPITTSYSAVDFGLSVPVSYTLWMDISGNNFANAKKVDATIADGQISFAQKKFNKTLLNMGIAPETEVSVDFMLDAYMQTEKGSNIEKYVQHSNVVTAVFTVYEETKGDLPVVDVPGDYQGWAPSDYPKLFNYSYDEVIYRGVVDFQCKKEDGSAANGFKITGGGNWNNDSGNWGSANQGEAAEAGSVQLINGDASQNIICYGAKRYYLFEFNKDALTLTKLMSFDKVGVIGLNGDWDNDVVMTYNMFRGRFWVDVDLAADTEFKFRLDGAWDNNWGGDLEDLKGGAGNIPIPAGQHRIYFYMNDVTLYGEINDEMYGKDEPTVDPTPGPVPAFEKLSLIGTIGGSSWDEDLDMTNIAGDTWIIRNVSLTASDEFKIRADHDWGISVGGPEANAKSIIDPTNPYDVFKPEIGVPFMTGSMNIMVGVEGLYDVIYDYAAGTITVNEHKPVYSLIGKINGDEWKIDVEMTQNGDIWTSPVVNITGEFKIRYDYSWDDDKTYGVEAGFTPVIGEGFTAVQPGKNITVPEAGDYKVSFNASTKEVTIFSVEFPEHLYMIGAEFGGWDWNSDGVVEMTPVCYQFNQDNLGIGEFWTVRYFTAKQGFKFCSQRAWNGDFWGLETNDGFVEDGGNCTVTEDGFYMVHVDLKRGMVHVEPARIYGMGNCFGGWNEGMETALFEADGKTLKAALQESGEIRMYAASSIADTDWWTREFIFFEGKIAYRGNAGDQDRVKGQKGQTVILDFNAGTASLEGQGEEPSVPETMYIIGNDFGGWDWASDGIVEMTPVNGKSGAFWAIRYMTTTTEFKFCSQKAWSGDFCTLDSNTGFVTPSNNMVKSDGLYIICVDYAAGKVAVEPANVYGIGDCFENGWDSGVEWTVADDGTVTSPVLKAGNVRMYTSAECFGVDWWRMEFNVYDGRIVYRGAGSDQEAVPCEAGKTVTLNFNAGTGEIK